MLKSLFEVIIYNFFCSTRLLYITIYIYIYVDKKVNIYIYVRSIGGRYISLSD